MTGLESELVSQNAEAQSDRKSKKRPSVGRLPKQEPEVLVRTIFFSDVLIG
jgi:hypothetical protein